MSLDYVGLTPAEVEEIQRYCRDQLFARWWVNTIEIAAQTAPDELRKAMGKVFDLAQVEDSTTRLMATLATAQQFGGAVRELVFSVGQDIDAIEERFDAQAFRAEQVEQRLDALLGRVEELERRMP